MKLLWQFRCPVLKMPKIEQIICVIVCLLAGVFPLFAGASGPEAARLFGPPPGGQPTEVLAGFYLSDLTSIEGEHELCVFEGVLTLT